jgi:hypothetical protein
MDAFATQRVRELTSGWQQGKARPGDHESRLEAAGRALPPDPTIATDAGLVAELALSGLNRGKLGLGYRWHHAETHQASSHRFLSCKKTDGRSLE